jgi:hypothetical protein
VVEPTAPADVHLQARHVGKVDLVVRQHEFLAAARALRDDQAPSGLVGWEHATHIVVCCKAEASPLNAALMGREPCPWNPHSDGEGSGTPLVH